MAIISAVNRATYAPATDLWTRSYANIGKGDVDDYKSQNL